MLPLANADVARRRAGYARNPWSIRAGPEPPGRRNLPAPGSHTRQHCFTPKRKRVPKHRPSTKLGAFAATGLTGLSAAKSVPAW